MDTPVFLHAQYLSSASASATDSFAGTDPDNVLAGNEDTFWRPANTSGDKTLTLDLGEAKSCDRLALVGDPLDGAAIDLLASSDNFASSVSVLSGATLQAQANAATVAFTGLTYRYWRLVFKNGFIPSPMRLAHVALGLEVRIPYLEQDFDPDAFEVEGEHMVSQSGIYLGTHIERTMRSIEIAMGQLSSGEFAAVKIWADACVGKKAFFFVPDRSEAPCYYGWIAGRFAAPRRNGLHAVAPLSFITRAP